MTPEELLKDFQQRTTDAQTDLDALLAEGDAALQGMIDRLKARHDELTARIATQKSVEESLQTIEEIKRHLWGG